MRGQEILKKFGGKFKSEEPIKVVILGPESTGKSTLSKKLADYYQTSSVLEYARQYLDDLGRLYEERDLIIIAKGQLQLEDECISKTNKYLFHDTNLITIKVWAEVKYGRVDPWILESLKTRTYDFYLLMDIDIPWKPDPMREHPEQRQELFDLHKNYLDSNALPYALISGFEERRLQNAIEAIEESSLSKI